MHPLDAGDYAGLRSAYTYLRSLHIDLSVGHKLCNLLKFCVAVVVYVLLSN